MASVVAASTKANKENLLSQIKIQINSTYLKVHDFIKNNFLKLTGFSLVTGSYFVFGFKVSIGLILSFATYQIGLKLYNAYKTSNYFGGKKSDIVKKISSFSTEKKDVVFLPSKRCLHNCSKWLREYTSKSLDEKKQMRKQIGMQTLETTKRFGVSGLFDLSRSEVDTMQQHTEIIGQEIKTKEDEKKHFDQALNKSTLPTKETQKVEIIEGDSFDVALTLKRERKYKNVSVLNMANKTSPGGGFLSGCSAQEEALCRRSNLFDSINIHPIGRNGSNFNPHLRRKMKGTYNVPEFGSIFSPGVRVFRANQDEDGYAYLKTPQEINVISSAAYDIAHSSKPTDYREKTKRKLQMILNTALENNQELVVLGAYGCGAFGNNPKEVASIVEEILKERPIYQKKMKIVFAIIKDRNDKGNIESFATLQNI